MGILSYNNRRCALWLSKKKLVSMNIFFRAPFFVIFTATISSRPAKNDLAKDGSEMMLILDGTFEMSRHHDSMSSTLSTHPVALDEFLYGFD